MAHVYLVTYDICDDKRVKDVYKTMRGFGEHLQYSVFRCELSDANKVRMKAALSEILDHRKDQVLIFNLGPAEGLREDLVESLGQGYVVEPRDAVVI